MDCAKYIDATVPLSLDILNIVVIRETAFYPPLSNAIATATSTDMMINFAYTCHITCHIIIIILTALLLVQLLLSFPSPVCLSPTVSGIF